MQIENRQSLSHSAVSVQLPSLLVTSCYCGAQQREERNQQADTRCICSRVGFEEHGREGLIDPNSSSSQCLRGQV